MIRFYHIINPYTCLEDSENHIVQKRTIESLLHASNFSRDVVEVSYVVRADPQDGNLNNLLTPLPNVMLCPLSKFSSDIEKFNVSRRLPLLSDIFSVDIPAHQDAYVIYTNMDICVTPYFYTECARLVKEGNESMVINRRTVDKHYIDLSLNDGFTAQSQNHPGHDCFIFPSSFLGIARIPDSILGIGYVFRPMLLNCILHFGEKFKEFDDVYLTMHFGDDMEWKESRYADYLEYNIAQLVEIWRSFSREIDEGSTNPYVSGLLQKHFPFSFLK